LNIQTHQDQVGVLEALKLQMKQVGVLEPVKCRTKQVGVPDSPEPEALKLRTKHAGVLEPEVLKLLTKQVENVKGLQNPEGMVQG
jgi:hypothetical protein